MPAQQTQHKAPVFLSVIALAYVWPVVLLWGASLLPTTPLFRYVLTAIGALGMLAIAFFAMRYDTVNLKAPGRSSKGLWHAVELLAAGWVLWAIVSISINVKMGRPLLENFESSLPHIVVLWLFVGIAEEVLFRGYILTRLVQIFGKLGRARSWLAGVALSSFIFATFHIPQRVIVHGMALRPDVLMWRYTSGEHEKRKPGYGTRGAWTVRMQCIPHVSGGRNRNMGKHQPGKAGHRGVVGTDNKSFHLQWFIGNTPIPPR